MALPTQAVRGVASLPGWLRRLGYYGLALLFVAAAAMLRWEMRDILSPTPFLVFYLAWVGAAAFGGLGPGLLATMASWLCVDFLFDTTPGQVGFADPTSIGRLVVLMAGGLSVSLVAERMRRGRLLERRQRRELAELARSLEREKGILQSVMNGAKNSHLVYLDRDFNFVRVNEAYARTCGYTPEEMVGKNHFVLYPHAENEAIFSRVRDTGVPVEVHDKPFVFPDQPERGTTYWDWTLTPVKNDSGYVEGLVFSLFETTQRKQVEEALREANEQLQQQAEELQTQTEELRLQTEELAVANAALRESEERLRQRAEEVETLMDLVPAAIWVAHDPQCNHIVGNQAGNRFYEAYGQENVSANVSPVRRFFRNGQELKPEELPMQEAAAQNIDIRNTELDVLLPSGKCLNMLGSASPLRDADGQVRGCIGAFMDITARRQAEEALRESEQRLSLAQQIAHVGTFDWDVRTGVNIWTPELEAMYGLPPGGFAKTQPAWEQLVHPEDRAEALRLVDQSFETGEPTKGEWRVVWPDGSVHWLAGRWQVFKDESGKPLRMTGVNIDITERKRAEEQLARSERQHRLLFETTPQGVVYQDIDGKIISMNPAAERILGKTPAEFLGRTSVDEEYHTLREDGSPFPGLEHPAMVSLRTGQEMRDVVMGVYNPREKAYRWINIASVPLFRPGEDKPYQVYTHFADITERKRAEEALRELNATLESKVAQRTAELQHRARQLQKLTLELSEAEERERKRLAEILHDDLQQVLAAAKFHLSVLSGRVKNDAASEQLTAQVKDLLGDAIGKSRSLSHELSPPGLAHNDLRETFEWLAGQVQTKHGLTVHLEVGDRIEVQSGPLKALLYRAAQELLFNVIKHARVREARLRLRRRRESIYLVVSDKGRGFDLQESGKTGGFGLLSIRERINLLGGRMKVRSTRGKGSTFLMVVPDALPAEAKG